MHGLFVEEGLRGRSAYLVVKGGRRGVQQFDVHDVEFHGIFIPDAVDTGFVIKSFEPDVAVGEGGFARFDKGLRARFRLTEDEKDRRGRMLVHEGSIVGWDVDVQYADPFILEYFMMSWLLAHLDLCVAGGRQPGDQQKEKGRLAQGANKELLVHAAR